MRCLPNMVHVHSCSLQGKCLLPLLFVHFDPPGWHTAEKRTFLQMAMQLQTRKKQTHCAQATPKRQAVEEPLTLPKAVKVASTSATDHRRQASPCAGGFGCCSRSNRVDGLCKLIKKTALWGRRTNQEWSKGRLAGFTARYSTNVQLMLNISSASSSGTAFVKLRLR